jgi:hypothetical protein
MVAHHFSELLHFRIVSHIDALLTAGYRKVKVAEA